MKKYIIIISISTAIFLIGFLYEKEIIFYSEEKENIKIFKNNQDQEWYDIVINSEEKLNIDLDNITNIKEIKLDGENIEINDIKNKDLEKGSIISIKTNNDIKDIEDNINLEEKEIEEEKEEISEIINQEEVELKILNTNYSSNMNNLLEFEGKNLENIDFITIGEFSYKANIDGDKAYVLVEKSTYNTGEYFIIYQTKDGKINYLQDKVYFNFSNEKINVANITPNNISNLENTYIVLQGEGFKKIISIQLSNNIVLKETNFQIINDNVLSLLIPKGINPGDYYLNIMDTDGIYKIDKKITIK